MSHSADPIPSWKRRVRRTLSRAWGVARQNPVPVGLAVVAWLCIVAQSVLSASPRKRQDVSDPAVRRGLYPGGRYGTLSRMKADRVPALEGVALPADWPAERSFVFGQADLVVSTLALQSKVQKNAYAWLEQAAREVNQGQDGESRKS